MSVDRFYTAHGSVQGVMFRQTLMRGAQSRGLSAAATNEDNGTVSFMLQGTPDAIDELIAVLEKGQAINSWGARVTRLERIKSGRPFSAYQVTTQNVDDFRWNQDIEMYL